MQRSDFYCFVYDLRGKCIYRLPNENGGEDQVIEEKKWREVIAAFKFPPTTTSASFVLRRYYLSLLHHYEQVYFFRTRGPLIPPAGAFSRSFCEISIISIVILRFATASSQTRAPPCRLEHSVVVSDSTMQTPKSRKRPLDEPQNRGET